MSFKDLHLIKPLQRAVEASGYAEPTLVQQRSIPLVLDRCDCVCTNWYR